MLERLRPTGDRIVIVSNYTQTLDLFSQLCRDRGVRPAPATSLFVILEHRMSRFMYIQYLAEAGPAQPALLRPEVRTAPAVLLFIVRKYLSVHTESFSGCWTCPNSVAASGGAPTLAVPLPLLYT